MMGARGEKRKSAEDAAAQAESKEGFTIPQGREPDPALSKALVEAKVKGYEERIAALEALRAEVVEGKRDDICTKIGGLRDRLKRKKQAHGVCRDLNKVNARSIFEFERSAIIAQYESSLEEVREGLRADLQAEAARLQEAQSGDTSEAEARANTRSLRSKAKDGEAPSGSAGRTRRKGYMSANSILEKSLDDVEIDCDLQDMVEENVSAMLSLVEEETAFASGVSSSAAEGAAGAKADVSRVTSGELLYHGAEGAEKFAKGDTVEVLDQRPEGEAKGSVGGESFIGVIVSLNLLGVLVEDDEGETMHVGIYDLRKGRYLLVRKELEDDDDEND